MLAEESFPDYSVIADVSETLQTVLTDAFQSLPGPPFPIAEIHDLSGNISTTPPRLTIFLFEVIEDSSMRNRPPATVSGPGNVTLTRPPMALLLRFLMTPWSGDRLTDYRILGRTLHALYDGAIISGPQLQGGLAGSDQALKLKLAPLDLDARSRVWFAVQQPYRLSVTYEVRVVNLDSLSQKLQPSVRSLHSEPATRVGPP